MAIFHLMLSETKSINKKNIILFSGNIQLYTFVECSLFLNMADIHISKQNMTGDKSNCLKVSVSSIFYTE